MSQVFILGGGISGLSAAYFLSRRGLPSTIIEAESRLGGLIRTDVVERCRLEAGPDSYIAAKPAVTELSNEIPGLAGKIIGSNDTSRRVFLVKDGHLVPMPAGMVMMVPGDVQAALDSPLFDTNAKEKFKQEQHERPKQRTGDVSIADFVLDHFGQTVLDYITEPLLAGVYGGDARKLSVASVLPRFLEYERRYGSLIRAVAQEQKSRAPGSLFLSFQDGMQTLTDTLQNELKPWLTVVRGEATSIERQAAGMWRVKVNSEWTAPGRVVLAVPAHRAAGIVENVSSKIAGELAGIPYSSAITVMIGYRREDIHHSLDGFGFLVPSIERRQLAACTWVNTKFPGRVAPGYAVLRGFIVDSDADGLIPAGDGEISEVVRREFQRLMGIDAMPAFQTINRWPKSMPQYLVGHGSRRERIQEALSGLPGIYLAGNAYDGVGIPDCVRTSRVIAERIWQTLTSYEPPPPSE